MAETRGPRPFSSESELDALLSDFGNAQIPRHLWTHREHLAIAALYLLDNRTLDEVRVGIQTLNEANGVPQTPTGGYHETVTQVWMKLLTNHLSQVEGSRLNLVNQVLATFGDRDYLFSYYSRDRLMSVEARYGWVEPDLKEI